MAVAWLTLPCGVAFAHKIQIFALAQDNAITGEVYSSGGGKVKNTQVELIDAQGNKIASTATDDEGKFRFPAVQGDYKIIAETPDGHRAECGVSLRSDAAAPCDNILADSASQPALAAPAIETMNSSPDTTGARAVQTEINQLREELRRENGRRRLTDIIGGIGYIMGLAGIFFYFKGKSRRRAERG